MSVTLSDFRPPNNGCYGHRWPVGAVRPFVKRTAAMFAASYSIDMGDQDSPRGGLTTRSYEPRSGVGLYARRVADRCPGVKAKSFERILLRIMSGEEQYVSEAVVDRLTTAVGVHPADVVGWDLYLGLVGEDVSS